ncbi:MAG TPA: 30S ribosomal protein S8 [Thermodesulfobacteriota bacterium]|uniref:Small ribosomal subunit protein uS8 n=1 Tax=uncultured delta proteobacterium Rifle_16ft_4_minimus_10129 TaxID=1665172 RepID=A0A0H4TJL3_9DELT|nr:30S ribosomal protein S8, small subunit ribosomal protein S8 [uncultured delta proteobacterium Rifle_16ft_4_minimus_10129]HLE09338.1 30S ribosomal protein S8 [Thermodesulfobacteriota bacterium]
MAMTDPVADMLTRIRNALRAKKQDVSVPSSKLKGEILKILKEEGYIEGYTQNGDIKVRLKYGPADRSVITEIKRISKPGKRVYVDVGGIPRVMNGIGIAVISTSRGIVTDEAARKLGVGGELLFTVY